MPNTLHGISLEEEFGRNPNCPKEDFYQLRDWLNSQFHLPRIPDNKLFQFFFSCYYDEEKTKRALQVYYEIKSDSPAFFTKRDVNNSSMRDILSLMHVCTLPVATPKGYRIIYEAFTKPDTSKFNLNECIKLFFMVYDAGIHTEGTVKGHVLLFDFKHVRFGHTFKGNFESWKKLIRLCQEGLAIRMKQIHIINTNYFVCKFAQCLKPFLNRRVFETIRLYREGELDELQKSIPKECLPKDYGGDLDSVELYSAQWVEEMSKLKDYFRDDENYICRK